MDSSSSPEKRVRAIKGFLELKKTSCYNLTLFLVVVELFQNKSV